MKITKFLTSSLKYILIGILSIATCRAQIAGAKTIAGRHGIWVVCGDQLPKDFTYHIQRQQKNGPWSDVADVTFPSSKEDIRATLLNTERSARIDIDPPDQGRLNLIWQRVRPDVIKDSPPEMLTDLPMRCAIGTAWYDGTADSLTAYQYKIQLVNNGKVISEETIKSDAYPAAKFNTVIKPILIKPMRSGMYAEYEVVDKGQMIKCKVFRSYYLRSGYTEIDALPIFTTRKGKLIVFFTDNTAINKVLYSYVLLPVDAAGNPGQFSPELRGFAVPDNTIVPSVNLFSANSHEITKSIKLSWHLKDPSNITSIDIFRSTVRNGLYSKIASVDQHDTTYYDRDVKPIITYWYTIRLNGVFETSPTSPRVPGILRAVNKNLFPPQNVLLKQNGNKVTITWRRVENDTRAYIIYRSTGKTGLLQQIGPVIVTDSVNVSYTDILPVSAKPVTYGYAVADENTSYAISPPSAPVYAHIGGNAPQPIPYNVIVNKLSETKLIIIWPDMSREGYHISGYLVYRRMQQPGSKSEDSILISKKLLPFSINHFIDSTVTNGAAYYYSVRTVGLDKKTLSSPSIESGYTINEEIPGAVSNIKVFPSNSIVELRWNNPIGQQTQSIKIYRSIQGKPSQLIATLAGDKEAYSDKDVAPGNIYYYTFNLLDAKGKVSTPTDPVGIHLR